MRTANRPNRKEPRAYGLVVPDNEQAYRSVVDRAGHGNLLRRAFISCTPARYLRPCDLFPHF